MYQAIEKEVFGYISRGDNFPWYNVYDFYPTRCVFCVPLIKARGQKSHNELVKEKSSWSYIPSQTMTNPRSIHITTVKTQF